MQLYSTGDIITREELSSIIGIDTKNKNFKRSGDRFLTSCGYKFSYIKKQYVINFAPQTIETRIKEILIRRFNLDVRSDTKAFAFFLYRFINDEDYQNMPWQKRADVLKEDYGIEIATSTLKKYFSKVKNIFESTKGQQIYKTTIINNEKIQLPVNDKKEYEQWKKELKEYMKEADRLYSEEIGKKSKSPKRQEYARIKYWNKYLTCYYPTKNIVPNGIVDEELQKLYELVNSLILELNSKEKDLILNT